MRKMNKMRRGEKKIKRMWKIVIMMSLKDRNNTFVPTVDSLPIVNNNNHHHHYQAVSNPLPHNHHNKTPPNNPFLPHSTPYSLPIQTLTSKTKINKNKKFPTPTFCPNCNKKTNNSPNSRKPPCNFSSSPLSSYNKQRKR